MSPGLRIQARTSVLRHLEAAGERVARGFARIASGSRIPRAAEDPAGLGLAERLRVRAASVRMARRNAESGLDLVRSVEGALGQVAELLQRLRELAVRGANGTLATEDRAVIAGEWDQLADELLRQARAANHGGIALLSEGRRVPLQVGPEAGQVVSIELADLRPIARLVLGAGPPVAGRPRTIRRALSVVDRALEWVAGRRASLGAAERRLGHAVLSLAHDAHQLEAAASRVADADLAFELAELVAAALVLSAGTALAAQANREGALVLELLRSVPPPPGRAEKSPAAGPETGPGRAQGNARGNAPDGLEPALDAHGRGRAGERGARGTARSGPGDAWKADFREREDRFGTAPSDG